MSISSPIKIATDNLVFYYNTDSARSYVGKPTTNYLTTALTPNSATKESFTGTITENSIIAPDGTLTAHRFEVPSGYVYQALTMPVETTVTYSVWIKTLDVVSTTSYGPYIWNYNSPTYGIVARDLSGVGLDWKRMSMTYTTLSHQSSFAISYAGTNGGMQGLYALWRPQLEYSLSATPFVNGTRSNTQGLLDMTGNYNIDLTSAGFDGAAGLLYSGAQNLSAGDMGSQFQNFTIDIWFKSNSVSSHRNPIDCNWLQYNGSYSNFGPRLEQDGSGNLAWTLGDIYGNYQNLTVVSSGLDVSKYHNTVITKDGTSLKIYYNGNLVTSTTATYTHPGYFKSVQIGRGFSTSSERWFSGTIPSCKIYNRALTVSELSLNYNTSKGRFGL